MADVYTRIAIFQHCINELSLTDRERALMREILMHIQGGTLAVWGANNMTRQAEVEALFRKCEALINAEAA